MNIYQLIQENHKDLEKLLRTQADILKNGEPNICVNFNSLRESLTRCEERETKLIKVEQLCTELGISVASLENAEMFQVGQLYTIRVINETLTTLAKTFDTCFVKVKHVRMGKNCDEESRLLTLIKQGLVMDQNRKNTFVLEDQGTYYTFQQNEKILDTWKLVKISLIND